MEKLKMIRGSIDRAEEVKAILKSWGATDNRKWHCDIQDNYYYVEPDGNINCINTNSCLLSYLNYEVGELPQPKEEVRYFFKPYDRVLVRDFNEAKWKCNIFSHYDADADEFVYVCVGASWKQCIPFEGNEQLAGTTNEPKGGNE